LPSLVGWQATQHIAGFVDLMIARKSARRPRASRRLTSYRKPISSDDGIECDPDVGGEQLR